MKVFRVTDEEWVCAKNKDEAINWFITDYADDSEIFDKEDVKECDLKKEGLWVDLLDKKKIAELNIIKKKLETGKSLRRLPFLCFPFCRFPRCRKSGCASKVVFTQSCPEHPWPNG